MEIVIIILLILLNGIFAMSEIALISARRSNLELRARQGNAGARRALRIIEDPDKFLSTIQIGITLIGILTGIYSGDALAAKFGRELALLGIPLRTATIAAQVTIVVIVTYLTLIFGELVPKRIGMNTAEKIACAVARPMRALSVAASPFVWLLSRSTAAITRLLGLKESDNKVTEEEIRSIIQESVDDGEVRVVEQQIVGRVFSLGDRAVDSVMTPRSEIVWIDIAMTTDQIRERVNRNPHSLYPVADGELDKLVGVSTSKTSSSTSQNPTSTSAKRSGRSSSSMKAAKSITPWTSCAANSWATASSATSSVSRAASSPSKTSSKPSSAKFPKTSTNPTSCGAKTGAAWWTGSAPSTIFWPTSTWRRSFRTPLTKRSAG